jgi:hypothetical protein
MTRVGETKVGTRGGAATIIAPYGNPLDAKDAYYVAHHHRAYL